MRINQTVSVALRMFDHKCLDSDDKSDLNNNQMKSNENSICFPMSPFFSWPSWDDVTQGRSGSLLKGCVWCVCVCVCSVSVCVCFAAQDTDASASYKSKCFKWLLSINYKIHVEAREPSCVNWHTHTERERVFQHTRTHKCANPPQQRKMDLGTDC